MFGRRVLQAVLRTAGIIRRVSSKFLPTFMPIFPLVITRSESERIFTIFDAWRYGYFNKMRRNRLHFKYTIYE